MHATLALVAGEVRGVVLESAAGGPPRGMRVAEIRGLFDETVQFWQSVLMGSSFVISVYLQQERGYSAIETSGARHAGPTHD